MAKTPGNSRRPPDGRREHQSKWKAFILFAGTLITLVMLIIASGLIMLRIGQQKIALRPNSEDIFQGQGRLPSDAIPPFEIFSEDDAEETPLGPLPDVHAPDRVPKVAILIDDLGYDRRRAQAFIDLGAPLTFSILPHSPFQKEIVDAALSAGNEIMLHLPMEPREYPKADPGPGALLMSMSPEAFTRQLVENLEAIPGIKGVNNHMGSRMTADQDRMTILFSVLKERNLFFVDSRTSTKSVASLVAKATKLDFAHRDVFLDHIPASAFVEKQLGKLLKQASRQGTAIGIAHPNIATYRILQVQLPHIERNAMMVPVSSIIYQRLADADGLEPPASTLPIPDPELR